MPLRNRPFLPRGLLHRLPACLAAILYAGAPNQTFLVSPLCIKHKVARPGLKTTVIVRADEASPKGLNVAPFKATTFFPAAPATFVLHPDLKLCSLGVRKPNSLNEGRLLSHPRFF